MALKDQALLYSVIREAEFEKTPEVLSIIDNALFLDPKNSLALWLRAIASYARYLYDWSDDTKDDLQVAWNSASGGVTGSCLCGTVVFDITEPFKVVYNCYCGRCQKGRGAAFATNSYVSAQAVQFVSGEDNLGRYKVPDARFFTQVFCRTCGTLMSNVDLDRGIAVVPFGALDEYPKATIQSNIYVADKAAWFEITDSLPRFEGGSPN